MMCSISSALSITPHQPSAAIVCGQRQYKISLQCIGTFSPRVTPPQHKLVNNIQSDLDRNDILLASLRPQKYSRQLFITKYFLVGSKVSYGETLIRTKKYLVTEAPLAQPCSNRIQIYILLVPIHISDYTFNNN